MTVIIDKSFNDADVVVTTDTIEMIGNPELRSLWLKTDEKVTITGDFSAETMRIKSGAQLDTKWFNNVKTIRISKPINNRVVIVSSTLREFTGDLYIDNPIEYVEFQDAVYKFKSLRLPDSCLYVESVGSKFPNLESRLHDIYGELLAKKDEE